MCAALRIAYLPQRHVALTLLALGPMSYGRAPRFAVDQRRAGDLVALGLAVVTRCPDPLLSITTAGRELLDRWGV